MAANRPLVGIGPGRGGVRDSLGRGAGHDDGAGRRVCVGRREVEMIRWWGALCSSAAPTAPDIEQDEVPGMQWSAVLAFWIKNKPNYYFLISLTPLGTTKTNARSGIGAFKTSL